MGGKYLVTSRPVPELSALNNEEVKLENIDATDVDVTAKVGKFNGLARLQLSSDKLKDFTLTLSNDAGRKVIVNYDKAGNNYYLDRTTSGKINFEKGFAAKHTAPRFSSKSNMDMTLIIDQSSIELFADDGLTVMTQIFFPNTPYNRITLQSPDYFLIKSLQYNLLKSIWTM